MAPRPRSDVREEAILLAALGLLGEVGYDQLTMDAVAERARASKATIYRRWPGKADLVATAVRRYATTPADPPETSTLRDDLLAVLRALRTTLTGQDAALILELLVAMRRDENLAATIRAHVLDHKRDAFASAITRAAFRGEIPPTADHMLAAELSSAALFSRLLVTGDPLDDAYLHKLVDAVLLPLLTRDE